METGIDDARSRPTCPAVVKLRTLFQDKSKTALNAAFNEFVNKLCYRNSEKAIVVKDCNSLNLIEFKIAIMKTFRDVFLFTEVKDIFIFFDSSRTGRVQRDQFITGMRGVLSEYRQRIVNFVFYGLNKNSSGHIEERELRIYFMRSSSSNAACRESFAVEKTSEFIKEHGSNNRISLDQFTDYYLTKSLAITSDAKFKSECIEQWLVNKDDSELLPDTLKDPGPPSTSRRKSTGTINPLERDTLPAEDSSISIDSTSNLPLIRPEALQPDPPSLPIRPGAKSPKVLRTFLRLGTSESIASIDENFASTRISSDLDVASDDSGDTPETSTRSESNSRSVGLEDDMYPIHRRHSQATTVSDDSFTQTTSDLVHLHYPLPYPNPYPLHGHIERDSLSYSAVRDDVTSHTTSDLNHCIKMLQSRIDAQQEVIAAQKSAIYEQSESIRTLELNIEYWTNLK